MTTTQNRVRDVLLVLHTTCGIEFEVVDAKTDKSLTGRIFWCDESEADEIEGWTKARRFCMANNYNIVGTVWS